MNILTVPVTSRFSILLTEMLYEKLSWFRCCTLTMVEPLGVKSRPRDNSMSLLFQWLFKVFGLAPGVTIRTSDTVTPGKLSCKNRVRSKMKSITSVILTYLLVAVGWQTVLEQYEQLVDEHVPSVEDGVSHGSGRVAHDCKRFLQNKVNL